MTEEDYNIDIFVSSRGRAVLTAEIKEAARKLLRDKDFMAEFDDLLPNVIGQPEPPQFAEFLVIALSSSRHGDAAIGCLNERFTRECEEYGVKRARLRYWAKAAKSIAPLLVRAVGKALKWGVVVAAVKRFF